MDPQEGDIARGPNGEVAVFRNGQWVVQGQAQAPAQGQPPVPGFVPFQSPADRRAEEAARRAEASAARLEANDARRVEIEGRTADRQGVQDEIGLKTKFESLPEVREFPVVRDQYEIIRRTANDASPAGDLALVTAYMKMLDPGSVVREQEFANAANAGGALERAKAVLSDITGNGILTPKQRADFVAQSRGIYEVRATTYNGRINEFRALAENYGFSPDAIGQPIEIDTAPISANRQNITAEEANDPNLLSAQGYRYDGETDTWVRERPDPTRAAAAAARSQEQGIGRRASAFMEGMADTVSFGFDDEISAAANAILPMDDRQSSIWQGKGFGDAYRENRSRYAGIDDADIQDMPITRGAGQVAGGIVAPGAMAGGRFIAAAPNLAQAGTRGAMVGGAAGGVYGAGSAQGGLGERLEGGGRGAATGAMIGGPMGAGGRAVGQAVAGQASRMMTSPRAQQVQTLQDHGVFLTPGQRMGGLAQTAENVGQRLPIVGSAIRGARERGVESLNRAVGNRALDAIGQGVPANVSPGGEMVGYVQGRLGEQFDRAYSMVPEINVNDPDLLAGLARIGQAKADLPEAAARQFDNIVQDRLSRLQGSVSGQDVGGIRSELNTLAGRYLRSQDAGQQDLGRMIAELGEELDGAISRANPEAGLLLAQARDGYTDYIRLERASEKAGGRLFGPGQLESAVRQSDGSVRRGAVGRGEARMQDLSSAARSVMPDQFGNPGTADTGAMIGLTGLTAVRPVEGAAALGALSAGAGIYSQMGRKIVERLPVNASRRQLEDAVQELDALAQKDSNVISLRDEIARRIGRAVPAAAQQGVALERLMTGTTNR